MSISYIEGQLWKVHTWQFCDKTHFPTDICGLNCITHWIRTPSLSKDTRKRALLNNWSRQWLEHDCQSWIQHLNTNNADWWRQLTPNRVGTRGREKKKDGLGFFVVYNARCKNTEGYHLPSIHHGNLKTCIQKATSLIPVLAGRSERMHVFYSSETIPPNISQKKISSNALTLRWLMSYIYMEHPFLMCLDHTQRRSTVGRTPLDEWSARRRDLLPDNTRHSQQTNIHAPGGIRTQDLSRWAATGRSPAEILGSNPTGSMDICLLWVSCVVR